MTELHGINRTVKPATGEAIERAAIERAEPSAAELLERVILAGDLSKLTPAERTAYYAKVCASVGLNPLTRPFDYLWLQGKMILYARKDATDQLRPLRGVSITGLEDKLIGDVYVVKAHASTPNGRLDSSTGAVSIATLKGEALANAMMKAETKAKRRVTLSICGLGMLDETEIYDGGVAEQGPPVLPGVDERESLLATIKELGDELELNAEARKALWATHVGAGVLSNHAALDRLRAMKDALERSYVAAKAYRLNPEGTV